MIQSTQSKRLSIPCGNKVHFISLGCPRNLVDTEVMLGILLKAGYEPSQELDEADFIIINTCGFLAESREESLDVIGEAISARKEGCRLIVTGCMVQKHKQEILDQHPEVDYFLGSGDVESILTAVESQESGGVVTDARSYLEVGEVPRQVSTPEHYAYLKIAEGCRKRCSYCIIPDIKGPLKSKPMDRVLREFRVLRRQGVKEVILIAQDLGDWGKDLGYEGSQGLKVLLRELSQEPGDFWLRLLYLYPDEIDAELMDIMESDPRICPYLDMPIQHVDDSILKAMRRKTTGREICRSIEGLRERLPMVSIRTSLIVGFPGETEEQFQELLNFVQEYPLDNVGVFCFSPEKGTAAARLENQVSEEVKEDRRDRLMEVQQAVAEKLLSKWIGKKITVLVEGYHPDSDLLLRGRHQGQCPEIDGMVIINDWDAVEAFGEFYSVEITGVAGYDLVGQVTSS